MIINVCYSHAVVDLASQAYIYFYPILVNMIALFFNSIWPHNPDYFPVNLEILNNEGRILDWTNPSLHDSSAEQLYSRTWLDLEEHPVVFNVPAMTPHEVLAVS